MPRHDRRGLEAFKFVYCGCSAVCLCSVGTASTATQVFAQSGREGRQRLFVWYARWIGPRLVGRRWRGDVATICLAVNTAGDIAAYDLAVAWMFEIPVSAFPGDDRWRSKHLLELRAPARRVCLKHHDTGGVACRHANV